MTMQAIQKQQNGGGALNIKDLLESRKASLASLVPKHLTADRLIKVALGCISKTPMLQKCNAASLLQAVIVAAELGLEPGGALGHLYLVPYGNTCTPIVGYRGFIELMRRSGQLAQIEAHVVHEADEFQVEFGLSPVFRHKPTLTGDSGKPVLAYVLARLKDGSAHCEVMTIEEIEKVRKRSRSGSNGPWVTDYEEMCKKTVLRRAAKYLPLSAEVARAIEVDDEDFVEGSIVPDAASQAVTEQATAASPSKSNEKAKAALKAKSRVQVIDVAQGETEAQAEQRAATEPERDPNTGEIIPDSIGQEIPPPTDADFVPVGA